jgi:hypothetical protein
VDDTTPSPADGDITNPQDTSWESRYTGLQKVLSKRDGELTSATTELGQLKDEHAKTIAELDTYRQRDVDASEEDIARQQFEALKERFDPPPKPIGNNPQRDWAEGSGSRYADRPRAGTSQGWPT